MSGAGLIRPAADGDIAQIVAIPPPAYPVYVQRMGREPSTVRADFQAAVAGRQLVVMELGGEVKGYMLAWPQEDAYWIDNIAVDPACQGRGLGRRLVKHAVTEARRLGLPALRLC